MLQQHRCSAFLSVKMSFYVLWTALSMLSVICNRSIYRSMICICGLVAPNREAEQAMPGHFSGVSLFFFRFGLKNGAPKNPPALTPPLHVRWARHDVSAHPEADDCHSDTPSPPQTPWEAAPGSV